MIGPHDLFEKAVHVLLGRVEVHAQLLQDHQPLLLQLGRVQPGLEEHVAHYIDGQLGPVLGHPGPVHGQLLIGGRVQHPAHPLDRLRNLFSAGITGGALEEHMFEEVGYPGELVRLVAGTHPEHDRQADRRPVWEFDGD